MTDFGIPCGWHASTERRNPRGATAFTHGALKNLVRVAAIVGLTFSVAPYNVEAQTTGEDIKALQLRLSSDGCYAGAIDGQSSPALDAAVKACPTQEPILRIETGMHSATIWRAAVDAGCRLAVTGSDDKTVRLWSLPDGQLLRTQRLPIGAGRLGITNAVALSPDGRWVAAGGFDAFSAIDGRHSVYLFDAATGQTSRRLGSLESAIQEIAFSPDAKLMAVGALAGGVHVIDVATGQETIFDSDIRAPVEGLMFGPDGSLYATSVDGFLHHYSSTAPPQKVATRGGRQPYSVAVDPTGRRIAVGFLDTPGVEEFDAQSLTQLGFADTRDLAGGHLPSLAWAADGQTLFAAGVAGGDSPSGGTKRFIRRFGLDGARIGDDTPVSDGSIMSVSPCGSGVVFGSSDPSFGLLHQNGEAVVLGRGRIADMRDKLADAFQVSEDGTRVFFGMGFGTIDPVLVDVLAGRLDAAPRNVAPDMAPPDVTSLPIKNWQNSNSVRLGRRRSLSMSTNLFRSLAIRPGRSGFVFGTSDLLLAYDAGGRELWKAPAFAEAWGVNLAQGGNVVVAALGDGTIRWHRWSDGKELLALFVDRMDKRWVAWTPSGYYMASPGGENLIGWHVNRGWTQAAEFFPASRFRARFNRPDIVRLVLETLDEDRAIAQANAAAGRQQATQPLIAQLPPLIRILDPASGTHATSGSVTIDYSFRSPSGLPVDRIDVTVDGRPVKEVGLQVHTLAGDQEVAGAVTLDLRTYQSDVGLIAWSGDLSSQPAHIALTWPGAPAATSASRKLHILVAGVSTYAEPDMKLAFAAKDATDFAKALDAQKGLYYGKVESRVLTDAQVTRESLTQGLDWLKAVATDPDDVSILFLAGHGLTDSKGAYWYFPADANADNMRLKGLSQEEIRKSLQGVKGKVLWFLDTCHAGAAAKRAPADMNVLLNTVTAPENGGIVVFASSTGREVSIESKDLQNGAFTKALIEGIEQGKAAFVKQQITTSSLDGFVESRVKELTENMQTPVMERPPQQPDFAIAQAAK